MEEPSAAGLPVPHAGRRCADSELLYLSGTNTRRVRRVLAALFGGAVGKDAVSLTWRKVKGDWDAWNARSLAEEPIVRPILDGTVVCGTARPQGDLHFIAGRPRRAPGRIKPYSDPETDLHRRYIRWSCDNVITDCPSYHAGFVLNNFVREWGHQFIYD
jgi:hypothetical protein